MTAWQELLLKLTTLFSFCGGPMVLADALEPGVGDPWHFVIAFSPVATAAMGTFALREREHDSIARVFVWTGLFGALALLGLVPYGVVELMVNAGRADAPLIWIGLAVGTAAGFGYLYAFRLWLAAEPPAAP